jgi:hypothetical protein
LIEFFSS